MTPAFISPGLPPSPPPHRLAHPLTHGGEERLVVTDHFTLSKRPPQRRPPHTMTPHLTPTPGFDTTWVTQTHGWTDVPRLPDGLCIQFAVAHHTRRLGNPPAVYRRDMVRCVSFLLPLAAVGTTVLRIPRLRNVRMPQLPSWNTLHPTIH